VDAWVCTPFESGPEALDDLALRIAAALASRDLSIAIPTEPMCVDGITEPH
jgi:hypothetical protein